MDASSIWPAVSGVVAPSAPLQHDREVDVVIVGAGITGLTVALRLGDAGGMRIAVLEADVVASGTTGASTGNLYATVDQGLARIRQKRGATTLREVVGARLAAMTLIRETVARFNIDCGLVRSPLYLCVAADNPGQLEMLEREREAMIAAGLPVEDTVDVPLPFSVEKALRLDEQGQLNPTAYARGLAAALPAASCQIYENSQVIEVDADAGIVRTGLARVRAKYVVFATHTPKGVSLLHTELGPYREYGIAARIDGTPVPAGAFWILDEKRSVRGYRSDSEDYLIVIGEQHKTGHQSERARYYDTLTDYGQALFGIREADYRWSAQNYRPADELPYIGCSPGHDNIYVGTGYATSGLVYGTLAGMLISDLILGRNNRWQAIFDSRRFTPMKSAARLLKENVQVASDLLKDYVAPAELEHVEEVPRGEGRVVKLGGEKTAVYRAADDSLIMLSPVCPHMKCMVRWNTLDNSWDCPCHGSRFQADGAYIEGPALRGLEPRVPDTKS